MLPNTMDPITQMFIDNRGQTLTIALINGFNVTIRSEVGKLSGALEEARAELETLRKQLGVEEQEATQEEGVATAATEQPEVK